MGPINVLVVLLDDVGVDKVAAYGYPDAVQTPVIQSLVDEGVRFDEAWATPVCSPTRAALLTGQFADKNRVGAVILAQSAVEMPLEVVTIPEMLAGSGTHWSTAAIGKWHLATNKSPSGTQHPWRQGFDQFAGSMNNIQVPAGVLPEVARSYAAWERVGFDGVSALETTFSTQKITDDALDALSRMREPFFLYVAYHAAHRPLMVPPVELTDGLIGSEPGRIDAARVASGDETALFDLNLAVADRQIGRILDGLGDRRARTLVLVIGDNGTPSYVKDEDGQAGAKGSFTEGGLRVPFVAAGPPVTARGVSHALVSVADVFPTVMALAGVDHVDAALSGVSLLPAMADLAAPVHERLYSELRHPPGGPWERVDRAARDASLKVVDLEGELTVYRIDGFTETEVDGMHGDDRRRVKKLTAEIALHPVR